MLYLLTLPVFPHSGNKEVEAKTKPNQTKKMSWKHLIDNKALAVCYIQKATSEDNIKI